MPAQFIFRIILLVIFVFNSVVPAIAQVPVQIKSTLSSGAGTNFVSASGKRYGVIQSIGQSSVIGYFPNNKLCAGQGFLYPTVFKAVVCKEIYKNAEIYPNPFVSSFSVFFRDEIRNNLFVQMFSMDGRVVYSGKLAPSREIVLNPGAIQSGLYIVRIITDRQLYTYRIIKR